MHDGAVAVAPVAAGPHHPAGQRQNLAPGMNLDQLTMQLIDSVLRIARAARAGWRE